MGQATGKCKHCGQSRLVSCDPADSPEEHDEMASSQCDCYESRRASNIEKQVAHANERIEQLFGNEAPEQGFSPIKNDSAIALMKRAVAAIAEYNLQNMTVQINGNCKAKISINAKDKIEVMRTQTISRKLTE